MALPTRRMLMMIMSDYPEPDVCFGTDEEMLAWAAREQLPIFRDEDGHHDWSEVYEVYCRRLRAGAEAEGGSAGD